MVISNLENAQERVASERVTRVFPVGNLVDRSCGFDELAILNLVNRFVTPADWASVNGPCNLDWVPGGLIVRHNRETLLEIERLLTRLGRFSDPYQVAPSDEIAEEKRLDEVLSRPVSIHWSQRPLEEAIPELLLEHGISKISFDTQGMARDGVQSNTPLTVSLQGVPLRTALHRIVHDELGLGWYVDSAGTFVLTTEEIEEGRVNLRFYRLPRVAARILATDDHALEDAIEGFVDIQSWVSLGGPGSMQKVPGGLAVAQTRQAHEELARFLVGLSRLSDPNEPDFTLEANAAASAGLRRWLSAPVTCDVYGEPLKSVLDEMAAAPDFSGRLHIDYRVLDDAEVCLQSPVTLHVHDISRAAAMRWMLGPLGIGWIDDDGILEVTSAEKAEATPTTRLFHVPESSVGAAPNACDTFRRLIEQVVSPQNWEGVGGFASALVLPGGLAISQTPSMQEEVDRLLARLRPILSDAGSPLPPEPRTPACQRIGEALSSSVSLEVHDEPLEIVLRKLADRFGINVLFFSRRVPGLDPSRNPVSLEVHDIGLSALLDQLLAPLGLDWVVRDDVLAVTTREEARTMLEMRLYDLRPFLEPAGSWAEKELSQALAAALAAKGESQSAGKGLTMLRGILICVQGRRNHAALEALLRDGGGGLERLRELLVELKTGDPPVALRRSLSDPSPLIRYYAIRAAARLEADAAAELAMPLLHDPEDRVRVVAAKVVGRTRIQETRFAEALSACLGDPDAEVRRAALEALTAFGPNAAPAAPALAAAARTELRDEVFTALVAIGPASVPSLVAMLEEDGNLASPACQALEEIGPDAEGAVPALLTRLQDRLPDDRAEAAQALAAIGGSPEVVVPALVEALQAPDNFKSNGGTAVRASACEALGKFAPRSPKSLQARQALRTIESLLEDEDPAVRLAAVHTLGAVGEDAAGALPALLVVAGEDELRDEAMRAIAAIGPKAVPLLITVLQEGPWLAAPACRALGDIGKPAAPAVPWIAKVLDDPSIENRTAACEALGDIGVSAKSAVPALAAALRAPFNGGTTQQAIALRQAACQALAKFAPQAAAAKPALQAALGDPDPAVRAAARTALDAF